MAGWEVVAVERLTMHRVNRLADMYVLSPFVWRDGERFHVLLRAVPRRDDDPRLKMAEIWHGVSDCGMHFTMDVAPVVYPGPDLVDLDGCEDPTVRIDEGQVRVWYSGYNERQKVGRLLLARGPDLARMSKAGIVVDHGPAFGNPKEAAVGALPDGGWRLFLEYARDGASLIGQAVADELDGPWRDLAPSRLAPRPDRWDSWHMSPGPIVGEGSEAPTIFYNGATRDAHWRIGWAVLDPSLSQVTTRCDDPIVSPMGPIGDGETDIAFVASAVERDDEVLLYFSQSDQDMRRAVLKRTS